MAVALSGAGFSTATTDCAGCVLTASSTCAVLLASIIFFCSAATGSLLEGETATDSPLEGEGETATDSPLEGEGETATGSPLEGEGTTSTDAALNGCNPIKVNA